MDWMGRLLQYHAKCENLVYDTARLPVRQFAHALRPSKNVWPEHNASMSKFTTVRNFVQMTSTARSSSQEQACGITPGQQCRQIPVHLRS